MSKEAGKELAVVNNYAVMNLDGDPKNALAENLGDEKIDARDLEKIQVPGSGSTMWVVPTLEGEIETKELLGIIVNTKNIRLFWSNSLDETGGGEPPACYSDDGIHGVGDPGGLCETCLNAQWGSGKGEKAQACQSRRLLFILLPDSILPAVLSVPPSSLRGAKQYLLRLASKGTPVHSVVTKLTLTKDKNDAGIAYSKINFSVATRLDGETAEKIKSYAVGIKPYLSSSTRQMGINGDLD